jgi:hypothetical protein
VRVKLKKGHRLLPVAPGSRGEVIGFRIQTWRGTDSPDEVVFDCIFHGYPGTFQMSPYALENDR